MLITDTGSFSRRIAENSAKWSEVVQAYAPEAVTAAALAPFALTAAGHFATWYAERESTNDFGFMLCWSLALLSLPLLLWTRRRVLQERRLPIHYWFQSLTQNTWLALLAWHVTPAFTPVLFFVLCLFLFTDARTFYDATELKIIYSAMWFTQPLLLLLLDAIGSNGLIASIHETPDRTAIVFLTEGCILALSLTIIHIVGKGYYERDLAAHTSAHLRTVMAAMKTERSVLSRSCDFLLQGLTAGRFSHDVASPLSVLQMEVVRLIALFESGAYGVLDEKVRCSLERIQTATERTQSMTKSLARSLRDPGEPLSIQLSELIEQAIDHAIMLTKKSDTIFQPPVLELEPSQIVVSHDHMAAIAGVLANGILQRPECPVHVKGGTINDYFCHLSIRDWGVDPRDRQQAFIRVENHLSLQPNFASQEREQSYDGYGISLLLTKALIVRWGGWMAPRVPDEDSGIAFDFILPRVAPTSIPESQNTPEALLGARTAG